MGYYLVYVPLYLLSLLPLWFLYGISYLGYLIVYYGMRYRKPLVIKNITNSFPEMGEKEVKATAKKFYRAFVDHFAEMLKGASASPERYRKLVTPHDFGILDKYYAEKRNVLLCMGHCGNWEILNTLPLFTKQTNYAAYSPLHNKISDRLMQTLRSRYGVVPIPAQSIARHILGSKNESNIYYFLADQWPVGGGNEKWRMTFLNQETAMYNGAEKLAQATGAAVVFMKMIQTRRGHYDFTCITISDDPKNTKETEITREYARLLEENIREAPPYWLWSHKRWKKLRSVKQEEGK